jgi:hypothetical protein
MYNRNEILIEKLNQIKELKYDNGLTEVKLNIYLLWKWILKYYLFNEKGCKNHINAYNNKWKGTIDKRLFQWDDIYL